MSLLDQLLVVQEHDTAIRQLLHRRETLPERAALTAAEQTIVSVDAASAPVQTERDDVAQKQSLIEDEVSLVEAKITREDAKLYSGEVTGMKELTALQDEIASLKRRQRDLEDRVIELMETAEPLDEHLASFAEQRSAAEARMAEISQAITVAEAEIDVEVERELRERTAAAGAIDAELLTQYDAIRERAGGIGVARFTNGLCEGCHLTMSAMETDRIKKAPADELVQCESCERLLVR